MPLLLSQERLSTQELLELGFPDGEEVKKLLELLALLDLQAHDPFADLLPLEKEMMLQMLATLGIPDAADLSSLMQQLHDVPDVRIDLPYPPLATADLKQEPNGGGGVRLRPPRLTISSTHASNFDPEAFDRGP